MASRIPVPNLQAPIDNPNIEGTSTFSGTVNVSGSLNLLGGTGIINSITRLTLNGTASLYSTPPSTNTTATASYGVNRITSVTSTNYCCRLPNPPVQGATITFVNDGGAPFYVFPSMIGGTIDNVKDGWIQIPNNGQAVTLTCTQNPNPGVWQSTTPSSTGGTVFTTDVISTPLGANKFLAFVNNSAYGVSNFSSGLGAYNALPQPPIAGGITPGLAGGAYSSLYPGSGPNSAWESINSITIKTNISGGLPYGIQNFRFTRGYSAGVYNTNTQILTPGNQGQTGVIIYSGSVYEPSFDQYVNTVIRPFYENIAEFSSYTQIIGASAGTLLNLGFNPNDWVKTIVSGTFTSSSNSNPYTSANPGDPGTATYTLTLPIATYSNFTPNPFKAIGHFYLCTFTKTDPTSVYYGQSFDYWYSSNIGLQIQGHPSISYSNLKIQTEYDVTLAS